MLYFFICYGSFSPTAGLKKRITRDEYNTLIADDFAKTRLDIQGLEYFDDLDMTINKVNYEGMRGLWDYSRHPEEFNIRLTAANREADVYESLMEAIKAATDAP